MQRYSATGMMSFADDGTWVQAADVDALLARIRAAVEAERGADTKLRWACLDAVDGRIAHERAQDASHVKRHAAAALDALLTSGECSSLCAPGSGERCMVTDDGECGS